MQDKKEILKNSMVPSFTLLIKQFFATGLFLSGIMLIITGLEFDSFTFFLMSIIGVFLPIALFFVWLRHFLKFKNAIKNIAKITFEPDSTVFKANMLMSLTGNFYRNATSKTGKTVKCFCFSNILEEKRCVLIKISDSYYSIVI
jgi:hypothetical protein